MDTEKRVLLAIVLSIGVLFLYQSLFAPPPPVRDMPSQEAEQDLEYAERDLSRPATPTSPRPQHLQPLTAPPETAPLRTDAVVIVDSQKFKAAFDASEGTLTSYTLYDYQEKIASPALITFIRGIISSAGDQKRDPLIGAPKELIHVPRTAPAPLRTSFVHSSGARGESAPWQADTDALRLSPGSPNTLSFVQDSESGLRQVKSFAFDATGYKFDLTLTVENASAHTHEGRIIIEWTAPIPKGNGGGFFSGNQHTMHSFAYLIKDSVEKKDLDKIKDLIVLEGDFSWTAIEEKYFTSVIIPESPKPYQIHIARQDADIIVYQIIYPMILIRPQESASIACSLYLGPKDMDILRAQSSRLEKTVQFGWFDIIAKPLIVSLKFLYSYVGNYGIAIILITIFIKILFWPLTHKSFSSMKGMQKIQPEIVKLKEKYKDNKEEFARQQLALYKKYKVNPLGGCLPMLLQIPVFIALYQGLMASIELRHANFISFWINDLSAKDPTYIAPIVMGVSMLLQQRLTPTAMDPAQAKMMMFMPIIFTVMFLNFPSGLVIYWLVNNLISIAQQLYINRKK
jgi:YidC/Oxa1 family membrane protein insertase